MDVLLIVFKLQIRLFLFTLTMLANKLAQKKGKKMKLVTSLGSFKISCKVEEINVHTNTVEGKTEVIATPASNGYFNMELGESSMDVEMTPEEFNYEVGQAVEQSKHACEKITELIENVFDTCFNRAMDIKEKEVNIRGYQAETDREQTLADKARQEANLQEALNRTEELKLQQAEFDAKYKS